MAKATACCTCKVCGNEFTVTKICYNRAQANGFEAWAAANIDTCNDCQAAAKRAAEEKETAAIIAVIPNLPALTGSEKQIAWAETIRAKAIKAWKAASSEDMLTPEGISIAREIVNEAVNNQTASAWWIDHRRNLDSAWLYQEMNKRADAICTEEDK